MKKEYLIIIPAFVLGCIFTLGILETFKRSAPVLDIRPIKPYVIEEQPLKSVNKEIKMKEAPVEAVWTYYINDVEVDEQTWLNHDDKYCLKHHEIH